MVAGAVASLAAPGLLVRRARWGNGCVESVYRCVCGHRCTNM